MKAKKKDTEIAKRIHQLILDVMKSESICYFDAFRRVSDVMALVGTHL